MPKYNRRTPAQIKAQIASAHRWLDKAEAEGKPFLMADFCRETHPKGYDRWIYNLIRPDTYQLRCRAADLQARLSGKPTYDELKDQELAPTDLP